MTRPRTTVALRLETWRVTCARSCGNLTELTVADWGEFRSSLEVSGWGVDVLSRGGWGIDSWSFEAFCPAHKPKDAGVYT